MSALLEVAGLSKRFGELHAVDGVDLTVEAGEIKAVIGPNGAGKSTLFNVIAGMSATRGRIAFKGHDITRVPRFERARHGLVKADQIVSIFPSLMVRENVALAVHARRASPWHVFASPRRLASDEAAAEALAARVGLADMLDQIAGELSHGDKKRLEIAVVLAAAPDLLMLDEPTSGMSPHESAMMADLIASIATGRTILLIEHDIDMVLALSHSVVVLHRGRVIAEGPPAEIERSREVQDAYLGGYR